MSAIADETEQRSNAFVFDKLGVVITLIAIWGGLFAPSPRSNPIVSWPGKHAGYSLRCRDGHSRRCSPSSVPPRLSPSCERRPGCGWQPASLRFWHSASRSDGQPNY